MGLGQNRSLVGGQVNHAIRDNHVKTCIGQIQLIEVFQIAFDKTHIGFFEAKGIPVKLDVTVGNSQLFVRHIHTHHFTGLTDQSGKHIAILPRATAQIQDPETTQQRRGNQAAAVVFATHFRVYFCHDRLDGIGNTVNRAAGIRLQILGTLQCPAVIVFNDIVHGTP